MGNGFTFWLVPTFLASPPTRFQNVRTKGRRRCSAAQGRVFVTGSEAVHWSSFGQPRFPKSLDQQLCV
jgi:hypothetical protein